YGLCLQAVRRVSTLAFAQRVSRHGYRAGNGAAHHPETRRAHLGGSSRQSGRDVLFYTERPQVISTTRDGDTRTPHGISTQLEEQGLPHGSCSKPDIIEPDQAALRFTVAHHHTLEDTLHRAYRATG